MYLVSPGSAIPDTSSMTSSAAIATEGRLILADALTFAERFKPAAVIDIATLTGAMITTLGSEASGLMGNNESLAQELLTAGMLSGDRAWELPLWEEYDPLLKSAFADIANIGNEQAKSIAGGCFLKHFATKYPWVHLDVAGVAYKGSPLIERSATGRPISLIMHYLLNKKN